MIYTYKIGNQKIELNSTIPLIENKYTKLFELNDNKNKVTISCNVVETSTFINDGKLITTTENIKLFRKNNMIYHQMMVQKNQQLYFQCIYEINDSLNIELNIKENDLYSRRFENIWSAMDLPHQLLVNNFLVFHSSSIKIEDETLLFLAPSGTGKSTQATLWNKYRGSNILNGDKCGVYFDNDNVISCGVPFCGTSDICYDFNYPIKAFVIIYQSKENKIEKLKGLNAIVNLMKNCLGHQDVLEDKEKIFNLIFKIVQKIPVLHFGCTPDYNAVKTLEKYLMEEL